MANQPLAPLGGFLDSILARLEALESKAGITPAEAGAFRAATSAVAAAQADDETGPHPRLVAYDEHVTRTVVPFASSCDALGGLTDVGPSILKIWSCVRTVVELGTKCKKPSNPVEAVQPYLKDANDAVTKIRTARLDRKYDWHVKGIMEMLVSVSWVVMSPPPSPANFVKDTLGSTEFWSNKIRKEYKGKDDDASKAQIAFCNTLKALILDLSAYLKEHHLSGLSWNPHGVPVSEAGPVGEASAPKSKPAAAPAPKAKATAAASGGGGGGMGNLMAELAQKRTDDGSSAATGLKKVTREQQTWRKEYKKDAAPPAPSGGGGIAKKAAAYEAAATGPKKAGAGVGGKKPLGPPLCEYQDRGHKWVIENQTKTTNPNGLCTVDVTDPKQQAYIYKCENATIQLNGKIKSVIVDGCTKCNLVFDTAISACELVNCKSIQVQTRGVCPSFSIDKTDGCLVYLSKETIPITSFVTSKSSEMNVSWPDDDGDMKETPIPEQFQHKLVNGSITSQVSDLYH